MKKVLAELTGSSTAMRRRKRSAPLSYLITNNWIGYLNPDQTILDFGAGHGADVRALDMNGHGIAFGYDPAHGIDRQLTAPDMLRGEVQTIVPIGMRFDLIFATYVLNVLPNDREVLNTLQEIDRLLNQDGRAFITVRADVKKKSATQRDVHLRIPLIKATSSYRIYLFESRRNQWRYSNPITRKGHK